MDTHDSAGADPNHIAEVAQRHKRRDEIIAGDLPDNEEVLIHASFLRDSIAHDRRVFLEHTLLEISTSERFDDNDALVAINQAVNDGSAKALSAARTAFGRNSCYDAGVRVDIYLACAGDNEAIHRLLDYSWSRRVEVGFGRLLRTATLRGLHACRGRGVLMLSAAQDADRVP